MMAFMQRISILLLVMFVHTFGWRPFTVQFLDERIENYHPEIINLNFTIKNGTFVDLEIDILREMSQLYIDFEDKHDSGNGTYNMLLMNRTVNVCTFLTNTKSNPIFAIIHQMLVGYMDMPKRCPLHKKQYKVVNMLIDPDKYPPFMPDFKARILAIVWSERNGRYGKKKNLIKFTFDTVLKRAFKGSVPR